MTNAPTTKWRSRIGFLSRLAPRPAPGSEARPVPAAGGRDAVPEVEAMRPHFDAAFYLESNPDVARSGMDPVLHYHRFGWREGRDPGPDFSTRFYLGTNPDVARAGVDPFHHWVAHGRHEGRPARRGPGDAGAAEVQAIRDHFDSRLYLETYPDVARSGMDPVLHYHEFGWREGRNPSLDFSTSYYLEANPDVARAGVDPFHHFVVRGQSEGRLPVRPAWNVIDALGALRPLEDRRRLARGPRPAHEMTAADLAGRLAGALAGGPGHLLVSISHDDPASLGGVQLCIRRESLLCPDFGRSYLHLRPWHRPVSLADERDDPDPAVEVVIDHEVLGVCPTSTVSAVLAQLCPSLRSLDVVVHHLMGHSPERVAELVRSAAGGRCHLWAHDFFTLSPSYALQRNDIAFCGAPDRHSDACMLCIYGEERPRHLDRLGAFFGGLAVDVLAPSQAAADLWRARAPYPHRSIRVVPLQRIEWTERPSPHPAETDGTITVAYAGQPTTLKGWPMFERIVRAHHGSGRFRFLHFGAESVHLRGLRHVPVSVSAEDPLAMSAALEGFGVDLLLNWSSAFETFSLTTHEALAAGAYVLTREGSGNIAEIVRATGRGRVLASAQDLLGLIEGPDLPHLVRTAREQRAARRGTLVPSAMTHPLLADASLPRKAAE